MSQNVEFVDAECRSSQWTWGTRQDMLPTLKTPKPFAEPKALKPFAEPMHRAKPGVAGLPPVCSDHIHSGHSVM